MVKTYIPKQGDIIYVDFNPSVGHEQAGKRPAIIVSNNVFNINTKMIIVCPITSNVKKFPTHYILQESKKIKGAVLCEHIRSIDYDKRNIKFVEKATELDILSVKTLIDICISE